MIRMCGQTDFWGQFRSMWSKVLFPGTEAYFNADLRLVVMKKPGRDDILLAEGIMLMNPDTGA